MREIYVYIGNWKTAGNDGDSHGLSVCSFDQANGKLRHLRTEFNELYIGSAYYDRVSGIYYCCDERADYPGVRSGGGGQVFALKIDRLTGSITEINRRSSYGANPSYCVTDLGSNYLLLTNYGARTTITQTDIDAFGKYYIKTLHDESSVVLYPLGSDGSIGEPLDIYRLSGTGPESFQLSPHAHSVKRSPSGKLFAVCDKGGDQVFMLRLDRGNKLAVCPRSPFHSLPGSAPRYSVFHPVKPFLYVNNEYKTIISVFLYDKDGELTFAENADALPAHIKDPEQLAQSDICIDAAGGHLYSMVRYSNVISVFDINPDSGGLTMIQCFENTPPGGRAFALSPDGRYLVAAFTDGKAVVSYPIDEHGKICPPVSAINLPAPATVTFSADS
jgi:6-phosphogluconolactonase (cycloisomerase 2 family)